ncbi:type IX secretion system membrane protein PorP/SprF [Neolewinella aurantiaca]|uniref:Type IX secretion system membrane protein PorP/SprF n=2 Tax=Neolewinella aurantiaca TaxID=2602767 RepID=A0A5C7FEY8_9BACT|nr:type IX secretion system membrane protein PorP/SprF [Neolewinella aurantiaca]
MAGAITRASLRRACNYLFPMKKIILLSLLLACLLPLAAQDPVFSQFYASPLRLNPAFAGIGTAPRVAFNYRAQHTSYPSAYTTMAASYDQPIENTPSGFGLRMMTDKQLEGAYKNTEVAVVYSYDVMINRDVHARLGLSAGILSTSLDFSSLTFGDVLDPINGADGITSEQLAALSKTSADFGAGVLFSAYNMYGGISFEHMNRPDESLVEVGQNLYSGRPMRTTLTGGAQINVKRYSNRRRPAYITPNFLFTSQASLRQLNMGAYFGYGPVAFGGWYRHAFENADGIIAAVSFRQDVLKIGFSYDAVVSDLRNVPGGLGSTLEASLIIDFGNSKELQRRRKADRYNDCYGMFR